MNTHPNVAKYLLSALFTLILLFLNVTEAWAHCDALDGPVVIEAQQALAQRDVAPILKWVHEEDEGEVREAFEQALIVREKGAEARALADRYFFETLVRLHRASEGEPYTGLKPAGTDPGPAVRATDRALERGDAGGLVQHITAEVEQGLRDRFEHARQARAQAGESVEAGRAYVAAYVELVHYAKRLLQDATHDATHVDTHGPERAHVVH